MNFALFLIGLWILRSIIALLDATYYWQLKEYRWDRMKVFLFQQGGHHHFLNIYHLLFIGGTLVFSLSWLLIPGLFDILETWYAPFVAVVLIAELLQIFHLFHLRQLKRPRVTAKSSLIVAFTFFTQLAFLGLFLWQTALNPDISSLALALGVLVIVEYDVLWLFVFIFNFFSQFAKRRIFKKAQTVRLARKDLKVIGMTGSFGKTSVKEYLAHILSKKWNVLKTDKNTNTEIGIAQTILHQLKPEHEVFVCEMGAYKKGEIAVCCQIARPSVGLFTGLNDQHAALFGSIDDTFKAKWELISSLPPEGLAVFNGDSPELTKRLLLTRPARMVCSLQSGDAIAQDIVVTRDKLAFTYKTQRFEASLIGEFQIINLLMSIVVAEHFGMALPDIAAQVRTIVPPEKTMVLKPIPKGFLLDDSYNVNTDGLKQAVVHLNRFEDHKKVLVFPGILELGADSLEVHEKLGEFISHHVDYAFFTDPNFSQALKTGALKGGLSHSHVFGTDSQESLKALVSDLMNEHSHEQWIFLFESRGAEKVMEWLREGSEGSEGSEGL